MNKHLQNRAILEELITVTAEQLSLTEPYVIEKDLYVTLAISALIKVENPHFKLIFQGGTALAKAHRIVQRMSEDCDFRIVQHTTELLRKDKQRRYLRQFRKDLIEALQNTGFKISDADIAVRNEGQFIGVSAVYPSVFPTAQGLKPHLALEFFLGDLRTSSLTKTITTLVRQTLGEQIAHPEITLEVMSLEETAAEKWVALTRRVATMAHHPGYHDLSLVRHLYDLYHIEKQHALTASFSKLVNTIIQQDQTQFKSHNTHYYQSPKTEIERALNELKNNPLWRQHWEVFMQTMVFEAQKPSYDQALNTLLKQASVITL